MTSSRVELRHNGWDALGDEAPGSSTYRTWATGVGTPTAAEASKLSLRRVCRFEPNTPGLVAAKHRDDEWTSEYRFLAAECSTSTLCGEHHIEREQQPWLGRQEIGGACERLMGEAPPSTNNFS